MDVVDVCVFLSLALFTSRLFEGAPKIEKRGRDITKEQQPLDLCQKIESEARKRWKPRTARSIQMGCKTEVLTFLGSLWRDKNMLGSIVAVVDTMYSQRREKMSPETTPNYLLPESLTLEEGCSHGTAPKKFTRPFHSCGSLYNIINVYNWYTADVSTWDTSKYFCNPLWNIVCTSLL